jgi:pimeloyl-ACP methyl ester carboxylesterase
MKTLNIKNAIYVGAEKRKSIVDFEVPENFNGKIILFIHGFMGFKDWGCWHIMQDLFVNQGFGFCKFNLSHNGGTVDNPIDFPDEEAFAMNTYSKELYDVHEIINWISSHHTKPYELFLIGHSRGGGISALVDNEKVSKKIFLAPVSSFESRFPVEKDLEDWKNSGFRTILNTRTKQHLQQSIEIWEDYYRNIDKLNIETVCIKNTVQSLIIHGNADEAVTIEEGRNLAKWMKSNFVEIKGANHTFGASHPWNQDELPENMKEVCDHILAFIS